MDQRNRSIMNKLVEIQPCQSTRDSLHQFTEMYMFALTVSIVDEETLSRQWMILHGSNTTCLFQLLDMDVKTAFLNGPLKEEVYVAQPEGVSLIRESRNKVLLMRNALYGLNQDQDPVMTETINNLTMMSNAFTKGLQ
ncbi:gag-pol polyprotein [Tanacetum coccineum]|uniref:Gag-pol polyprotein n=1 Tax=Tanacetum coccineum TaxID=301880 RepID=A0ABQ5G4T4_9ASTR